MKNKIKLSFDEYSILQFIKKETLLTFQDIVDYLYLYRNKTQTILESLINKKIVGRFDYNSNLVKGETEEEELVRAIKGAIYKLKQDKVIGYIAGNDYDNYFFEIISTSEIKVKKLFLWRIRFFITKQYRKKIRAISIKKNMIDMHRKNKRRIKEAGLKKQKTEQKRWAKRILKSKNTQKITLEIKEKGFFKDKANMIWTKVPILEIVEKGIFIVAKKDNWAIEINSNLANFERYEFLTLHTPFNICCFVRVRK